MSHRQNKPDNYSTNVRVSYFRRIFNFTSLFLLWYIQRNKLKRFLLKQFFSPKSYPLSDKEQYHLKQGTRHEILVNDQKVVYWKWGSGPVVIFAHGWNGRAAQFYRFIDKFVNHNYSVIAFDGPGHGESEGKTSSYFQMTDTVRCFIKHISSQNIQAIVGHSFGASATINAISKEHLDIPAVLISPAIKLKEFMLKTLQVHGVPTIIFDSMVAEYEKKYGYNFHRDNPFNLLKSHKLNALILHDSDDPVTPFPVSRQTANLYNSIHLTMTEGLGHNKILKEDFVINKTLEYINSTKPENTKWPQGISSKVHTN